MSAETPSRRTKNTVELPTTSLRRKRSLSVESPTRSRAAAAAPPVGVRKSIRFDQNAAYTPTKDHKSQVVHYHPPPAERTPSSRKTSAANGNHAPRRTAKRALFIPNEVFKRLEGIRMDDLTRLHARVLNRPADNAIVYRVTYRRPPKGVLTNTILVPIGLQEFEGTDLFHHTDAKLIDSRTTIREHRIPAPKGGMMFSRIFSEGDDIIGHVTLQKAADEPKYKNFHVTVYYNRTDRKGTEYASFQDQCSTYFNFDGEIEWTRRGRDELGGQKNVCVASSAGRPFELVDIKFRERVDVYTKELARKFTALLSVMTYTAEKHRDNSLSNEFAMYVNTSNGYNGRAAIQPLPTSHIVYSKFSRDARYDRR